MQLKELLPYIFFMEDVIIERADELDENGEYAETFRGSVGDVPWWLCDYYLYNSGYGESISINDLASERGMISITVVEDKDYHED